MVREEKKRSMGHSENAPGQSSSADTTPSLAARRARLRGSLVSRPDTGNENIPAESAVNLPESTSDNSILGNESIPERTAMAPINPSNPADIALPSPGPGNEVKESAPNNYSAGNSSNQFNIGIPSYLESALDSNSNTMLAQIDQSLNTCAVSLAALQKIAQEQTEVLKGLTDSLRKQATNEIGMNLNNLTESLGAALEPMKAVSELIPAMDSLVSILGEREVDTTEKLSPNELVTSLADQLSAGLINSNTFKCAYMAIYPADHPADLLHRLVELLGTQRLSGDLFRAAYEAVQSAQAPGASPTEFDEESIGDEQIRAQIAALNKANEELRARQDQKEKELREIINNKDKELEEAQEALNARYGEFKERYEEVAEALNQREEEFKTVIENKDMELIEKESELNLLRSQMEELRAQTEDMVKDMQKQLAEVKVAKQEAGSSTDKSKSQGFFESLPLPMGAQEEDQDVTMQAQPQAAMHPQIQPMQQSLAPAQANAQPAARPNPVREAQPSAAMVAQNAALQRNTAPQTPVPQPQSVPTTPLGGGSSYSSGVRAQVFEVIVRQALAGANWRELCAGPMQINNISADEVEAEVKRRQALLNK